MSEDAKADVPPPRYIEEGGWRRLVCDEQEWLARPASWGIDKLPDETRGRKCNLFNSYQCGWYAGFIECAECRARVQKLFTDDGRFFNDTEFTDWNLDASHECDAAAFRRQARFHLRGVITRVELDNRFIEELHLRYHAAVRHAAVPDGTPLDPARLFDTAGLSLELVGPNPFRPVAYSPEWRTDTAVSLARTMYESREFGAMPILADALQDAGCDSDAVLNHCRDTSLTHVRGCWVVDLVLGKSDGARS